jgi:hypothetical protein
MVGVTCAQAQYGSKYEYDLESKGVMMKNELKWLQWLISVSTG